MNQEMKGHFDYFIRLIMVYLFSRVYSDPPMPTFEIFGRHRLGNGFPESVGSK